MAYIKYTWENLPNVTTPISKANLDHLETQYDEAAADLVTHAALTIAHGATGAVVGTTNVQVLTNKTLTAPTLNGTTTLGATPVFYVGGTFLQVSGTAATSFLLLTTREDGSGARITTRHVSTTPAVNDHVFKLSAQGYDGDTPQNLLEYGIIYIDIEDPTADHADGNFELHLLRDQVISLALTVDSLGAVEADSTITGDAFDEFDDALILRRGISEGQLKVLQKLGVMRRKKRKEGGSGWMLNFQKMMYLLAGGVYQNRARFDGRFTELDKRLGKLELALPEGDKKWLELQSVQQE